MGVSECVGVGLFGCVGIYVGVGRCVFFWQLFDISVVLLHRERKRRKQSRAQIECDDGFSVSLCMH